jgi:uncharacterized membrane protein
MARFKVLSRWLLGGLFVIAGVSHFVNTDFYAGIVPPHLPWHRALVYISGAAESGFGALLLTRRWVAWAAWGLIALCVAVFPANLHMALHPDLYPSLPVIGLWLRLPLQGVLIGWAWWYTRDGTRDPRRRSSMRSKA